MEKGKKRSLGGIFLVLMIAVFSFSYHQEPFFSIALDVRENLLLVICLLAYVGATALLKYCIISGQIWPIMSMISLFFWAIIFSFSVATFLIRLILVDGVNIFSGLKIDQLFFLLIMFVINPLVDFLDFRRNYFSLLK